MKTDLIQTDFTSFVKPCSGGLGAEIKEGITFPQLSAAINTYYGSLQASWFILGDLFVYGEAHFETEFQQALQEHKISFKTFQNAKSICRGVPKEVRNPDLSWSHHAAIARLHDPEKQTAMLAEAAEKKYTVIELQEAVDKKFPGKPRPTKPKTPDVGKTPMTETAALNACEEVLEYLGSAFIQKHPSEWPKEKLQDWKAAAKPLQLLLRRILETK